MIHISTQDTSPRKQTYIQLFGLVSSLKKIQPIPPENHSLFCESLGCILPINYKGASSKNIPNRAIFMQLVLVAGWWVVRSLTVFTEIRGVEAAVATCVAVSVAEAVGRVTSAVARVTTDSVPRTRAGTYGMMNYTPSLNHCSCIMAVLLPS